MTDQRHQMGAYETVDVPEHTREKWQSIVDTMAELLEVPAALIMRLCDRDIEVFVSSRTEGNPYEPGAKEHFFDSGLYCETVVRTNECLLVPDALANEDWKDNPDVRLGMISYLGFPILLPNGKPFGTICVLDSKPNAYGRLYERLVVEFKELIESHLALLDLHEQLESQNAELNERLEEVRILRGIMPFCSWCKSVRNDEGYWQRVEEYLSSHLHTTFNHGVCPECAEREFGRPELHAVGYVN